MMKYFFIFILLVAKNCFAEDIALEHISIDIHDKKSIERGAKFFASNCMVCHTLVYLRYNSLAQKNGVQYDKMPINIKNWPNDVKPPDLSLIVSRRGVDWLYTYLHSFYTDPTRPTGANNLLVPNTAMPDVMMPFQGQQTRIPNPQKNKGFLPQKYQWYDLVELQSQGAMTSEQFDATMTDLVNFLQYASSPYQNDQEKMGWIVIIFLFLLFILTVFLKKSYWKDLKKPRQE